jgi:hypothetical protein
MPEAERHEVEACKVRPSAAADDWEHERPGQSKKEANTREHEEQADL